MELQVHENPKHLHQDVGKFAIIRLCEPIMGRQISNWLHHCHHCQVENSAIQSMRSQIPPPAHGKVLWHKAPSLMVYSLCISNDVNLTDLQKEKRSRLEDRERSEILYN